MRRTRAFTLVEILIVVVLLAILAAIVLPSVSSGTTMAKESALASELGLLRRFMVLYESQHLEVSPGYPDGDKGAAPTEQAFKNQAMLSSNAKGQTAAIGTPGFKYGPYLSKIPRNPFNDLDTILMLGNGEAFPGQPDGVHGWICKPEVGQIRAGNTGTNSAGTTYYDY